MLSHFTVLKQNGPEPNMRFVGWGRQLWHECQLPGVPAAGFSWRFAHFKGRYLARLKPTERRLITMALVGYLTILITQRPFLGSL